MIDTFGKLVGIISLNDIVHEAERLAGGARMEITEKEVGQTLGAICQHRQREIELAA